MGWVVTATIGAAVVGGVASNKASERAAEGQENALEVNTEAVRRAEGQVNKLFGEADKQQAEGFMNAREYLTGAIGEQIKPFQEGNMNAQRQVARGLPQIQNAIMGRPVDLSGFQARGVGVPQLDFDRFKRKSAPAPVTEPALNMQSINAGILSGLDNLGIGEQPMGGSSGGYDPFSRAGLNNQWLSV